MEHEVEKCHLCDEGKKWSTLKLKALEIGLNICYNCYLKNVTPTKQENDPASVDWVNEPPHYNTGKYEVIDVIEDKLSDEAFEGYCMGNVLKYIMRYKHKGGYEDLKKAKRYIEILLEKKDIV